MAGQTSASFNVGITIGGGTRTPVKSAKRLRLYTWNAAAISVQQAGFDNPVRMTRTDSLYWFGAERGGSRFRIAVSVTSGAVVRVIPA